MNAAPMTTRNRNRPMSWVPRRPAAFARSSASMGSISIGVACEGVGSRCGCTYGNGSGSCSRP